MGIGATGDAGGAGTSGPDWDTAGFRAEVDAALAAFLDEKARDLTPLGPDAARLVVEARTAVAGGKKLRAAFCAWGYRLVDPEPADPWSLVRACASLELLHASALAHDDLIDASDTRRGRPATHRAFADEHRAAGLPGDPERFGAAAAVLVGDLLLSWSAELLRRCGLEPDLVSDGFDVLETCRTEVIAGQFLDVSVQARGHADVDAAMTVLRYKSARYTVERPLHLGATLAGAAPEVVSALTGFGMPLGEAFQLRDDLLGVFGDPAVTGKPAGDDLVEGKRTVLVALALDGLGADDASVLDAALGTRLGEDDVARLRGLIEASGARDQVERVIAELAGRALAALDRPPLAALDPHARGVLRGLVAAATQRGL